MMALTEVELRAGGPPMKLLTRMTIRRQLILVFLLIVSPIFIINQLTTDTAEKILKDHVTDAYVELIKQNHSIIDRDIDTVHKIMNSIIQHPLTQSFTYPNSRQPVERVRQYEQMNELLNSHSLGVHGGQAMRYLFFVLDEENNYPFAPSHMTLNRSFVFFVSDADKPEWYDSAVELKGKGILTPIDSFDPGGGRTLALIRAVNDTSRGNHVIGVLIATNIDKQLGESVKTVSLPQGRIYLTDLQDRLLYGTDASREIGSAVALPAWNELTHTDSGVSYMIDERSIRVLHHNYFMQHKLLYDIPTDALVAQQNQLKRSIRWVSIVYFALCFLMVMYFLRSLISPVLKLVSFFKAYEPGKPIPDRRERREDEVGSLMASIHDMAERFNQVVHDRYVIELKHKESQLHLLYEQINPHLLYNTLESIYWKCTLQGDNEAAEMIKDLAKLMKIGLSRGRELIAIEEEAEHARAYVSLQQRRFDDRFTVTWAIDEDVRRNVIPKVTMQPMIENAIKHGIRRMGEDGEIAVTARREGARVIVRIADNGYKKTDVARLAALLEGEDGQSDGYGARNVHRRLRVHFGSDYGLVYEQRERQGVQVSIVLPLRQLDDADEQGGRPDV